MPLLTGSSEVRVPLPASAQCNALTATLASGFQLLENPVDAVETLVTLDNQTLVKGRW